MSLFRHPAVLGLFALACAAPNRHGSVPQAPHAAELAPDPDSFRSVPPKPGPHPAVQFPTPSMTTLKNGITLFVVPKRAAVTTLSVVVCHGASSLPLGESGLAALTARMLTEGTQRHSSLALAELSESLGSSLQAEAGRDESHVSLSTLTSDTARGLELLAEVVFSPSFAPTEFERVKAEWLDDLRAERQEPSRLASLAGLRAMLGPSAGAPVSGSIPDVEKLRVADLRAFHRKAYVPSNVAVVAVGDVTLAQLEPDVERLFGRVKGPAYPPPDVSVQAERPNPLRVLIVDRKGSVQSALFALQPFPKRSQPDFEAREILGTLLGGLFTSRLNLNLREQHAYTYGVQGEALATRRWGAFLVASSVKTEATADALSELLSELHQARDPKAGKPIQEQETARARTDLIHSLGARLEHTEAIADAVRDLFAEQLPPDYYSRYPELIANVSTEAVAEQATRLDPQHLLVVIVGDRLQIEPSLKRAGFTLEDAGPELLE